MRLLQGLCRAAIAAIALVLPAAHAWGPQGHQVIASMAQARLSPRAGAEVARLLALEPGATLASISTWADEQRSPQTAAWHYVNFPQGSCRFDAARDCPDGNCVVAAIQRQLDILGSGAPAEERLTALKFVVHLVGDIHQPLHAGHAEDRGGNTYQLEAFLRGSNLHAVWDLWLIRHLDLSNEALAARLQSRPAPDGAFQPALVAEESCRIVASPGFYPGRRIDVPYITQFMPVMEERLAWAAARLADALNRLWR